MAYTLHRCRFCGQTYYGGTRHRCPPPPPPPPPPPWVRKDSGDEIYLFATIALTLVALAVLIGLLLHPSTSPWVEEFVPVVLSGCGVSAVVGGAIGAGRGRLWYGVFWSLLGGPLGWLLAACAQDPRPRCPWCRMVIPDDATVCGHCARQLPQV